MADHHCFGCGAWIREPREEGVDKAIEAVVSRFVGALQAEESDVKSLNIDHAYKDMELYLHNFILQYAQEPTNEFPTKLGWTAISKARKYHRLSNKLLVQLKRLEFLELASRGAAGNKLEEVKKCIRATYELMKSQDDYHDSLSILTSRKIPIIALVISAAALAFTVAQFCYQMWWSNPTT